MMTKLIGRFCGGYLEIYGIGGRMLLTAKACYRDGTALVRDNDMESENCPISFGVRHGCVMFP